MARRHRPRRHRGAPPPRRSDLARRRLDAELVRRGLAPSRAQAQADIAAGRVTVGGAPAGKAARLVAPDEPILVLGPGPRFVGRGGEKLDAALTRFDVAVEGRRALDLGASTGGFTDCLLQRGASEVMAIDVGYGQLHERLRADPRVVVIERTNVRDLRPGDLGAPAELVVADLSFISLRAVLPAVLELTAAAAELVLLVKPQFEAGRVEASRGRGVISDPEVWRRVLREVTAALEQQGAAIMGAMASPLTGADGNVEFLVHARTATASTIEVGAAIDRAVAEAVGR
ncbi:MAG: TlyA family RNA methyltransferase [Acidimicrobiales bacterium]